jgi:hypothetical protein
MSLTGGVCGNSKIRADGGGNIRLGHFAFLRCVPILAKKAGRKIRPVQKYN